VTGATARFLMVRAGRRWWTVSSRSTDTCPPYARALYRCAARAMNCHTGHGDQLSAQKDLCCPLTRTFQCPWTPTSTNCGQTAKIGRASSVSPLPVARSGRTARTWSRRGRPRCDQQPCPE
jgi:hypothetical protein